MLCLEFTIPPLPQFVMVGHAVWQPGNQHFQRTFGVYDLLLVKRGTLYMTESGTAYAVRAGMMLLLEAGLPHYGHLPCEEETEIYWVHFVHGQQTELMEQEAIPWSSLISKGTVEDQAPTPLQHLYLPKFAQVELQLLAPILDELNEVHNHLCGGNAIRLHLLLTRLFTALQEECSRNLLLAPSARLNQAAVNYLNQHWREPFDSAGMERALHFQFDYITRCMKKHTGTTPLQYVLHLRLEEAKKLLSHTQLSIPEIAEAIGIPDFNYMTRQFSAKLGMTPGAYRRRQQTGGSTL
ncbi:putative HTH-type transcriptional regulator YisR [Paenibacillus albidus]|uniref:HTH-type transcriptional regulator YisR n=1 Tax=Paenibacillus albidus TaxID=2041023 RepID=A0A917BWE5_9BACL|nr:AraC family transcriptional regulator [Paenibacillus albidus]GGF61517.1 putative HTH-type transcriptional regulator YisR [Paenibacillus albidus]